MWNLSENIIKTTLDNACLEKVKSFLIKIFTTILLYVSSPYPSVRNSQVRLDSNQDIQNLTPQVNLKNDEKQDAMNFLNVACAVMNTVYYGDYAELNPFINSIKLLEHVVHESNTDLLRLFIISKLAGRAYDAVVNNSDSIEHLKKSLIETIKPDDHKLIEAKMIMLSRDNMNVFKFIDDGIILANNLETSLRGIGFPISLARSETIKTVVKMCLERTKSDFVKIALHATAHSDIQQVFAKFLSTSLNDHECSYNFHNNFSKHDHSRRHLLFRNNFKNQFYFRNTHSENHKLRCYNKQNSYENSFKNTKFNHITQKHHMISRNVNDHHQISNDNCYYNRYNFPRTVKRNETFNGYKSDHFSVNNSSRPKQFSTLITKSNVTHPMFLDNEINFKDEHLNQEHYSHGNENAMTSVESSTKVSSFRDKYSRNNSQNLDKNETCDPVNNDNKVNHSSKNPKNDTNYVMKTPTCNNTAESNSSSYSSIDSLDDFSQRKENNPYFKINNGKDTAKRMPSCQRYNEKPSIANSMVPLHKAKTVYSKSTSTKASGTSTPNFYLNTPTRGNYAYSTTSFYRNSHKYNSCSGSGRVTLDDNGKLYGMTKNDITKAEIEDLGAEWP